MNIFCAYVYVNTRTYKDIYAHIYAYLCAYVSLLCIPIRFLMWSIVSQTKTYFFGMKMASKQICILLKHHANQWKLSYFEYSITSIMQIHLQTTVYLHLLDLKLLKMGWKLKQSLELTILTHELFVSTSKELFIKVSMACCWH